MSKRNGSDCIYVVWKDSVERQRYVIGELSKDSEYVFKYNKDQVKKAIKKGFQLLIAFSDIEETYFNQSLFPVFNSRLPDRRRKDIEIVLDRYKLDKYDAFELLKRSGGRLPIDTLEFIEPIFMDSIDVITREFFVAGVRYYDMCSNQICPKLINLQIGEKLELVLEPNNKFDLNAVVVCKNNDEMLGYIPKYYSKEVFECIESGRRIDCSVVEANINNNCNECIKVNMDIYPSNKF